MDGLKTIDYLNSIYEMFNFTLQNIVFQFCKIYISDWISITINSLLNKPYLTYITHNSKYGEDYIAMRPSVIDLHKKTFFYLDSNGIYSDKIESNFVQNEIYKDIIYRVYLINEKNYHSTEYLYDILSYYETHLEQIELYKKAHNII